MVTFQLSGIDEWLATKLYIYTDNWQSKNNWWLDAVAHKGGRYLVIIVMLSLLSLTIVSYWRALWQPWQRKIGAYVCVATLSAIGIVSFLKGITTLPCPWDIQGFGGDRPPVYLYDVFASDLVTGHCFPAGHASGGYAFFSLYFAAKVWRCKSPQSSSYNLWFLPGAFLGTIFGIDQQLRGAHFLSHDIASALICWGVCALLYWGFFTRGEPAQIDINH